jgi:hypothetical protein
MLGHKIIQRRFATQMVWWKEQVIQGDQLSRMVTATGQKA